MSPAARWSTVSSREAALNEALVTLRERLAVVSEQLAVIAGQVAAVADAVGQWPRQTQMPPQFATARCAVTVHAREASRRGVHDVDVNA